MRTTTWILAVVFALTIGLLPPRAAADSPWIIDHVEFELGGVLPDACFGEEIRYQSRAEVTIWLVENAAGGYTWRTQYDEKGTAEGLSSGARYQIVGANNWTVQGAPSDTHTLHFQGHSSWVSQGAGQNINFTLLAHLTRTPGGEWTAQIERGEPRCTG